MTLDERNRITSNDYADLLINYNGNEGIFKDFEDATVQYIDFFNAIVHVPVGQINDSLITNRGYSVLPVLYGLISETSLEKSGITKVRNTPNLNLRGKGVIMGIIDTGINYINPIFRYADNTTRIISIWDQTINSDNYPLNYYYGTEYSRDQINQALKSEKPLEIVPSMDENGHGTMVAGIAAGNVDQANGFSGVAPDTELVIVKLKSAKPYLKEFFRFPKDAVCYQENDILLAFNYLLETAERVKRPIAICIALGSSLGAHDGTNILSSYISFQADNTGVAVVVAAGNEGNAKRHFYGVIDERAKKQVVELNVGENEQGFSMELWGDSPSLFTIDIISPSGEYVPRIPARMKEFRDVSFIFEQTTIRIDYKLIEAQSGDQLILLRFRKPSPGIWRFSVSGIGDIQLGFHIWLPMAGFISDNTYFVKPSPYTTILSPGNAHVPITVTAYDPSDSSLYTSASRGYTRSNDIKPDIAAPGVNILSPTLDHGFASVTGTSASAAHTAGVAAMLLEWGIVRGNLDTMSTLIIKNLMLRGANRKTDVKYPNKDWGYGILDVYNIFSSLIKNVT